MLKQSIWFIILIVAGAVACSSPTATQPDVQPTVGATATVMPAVTAPSHPANLAPAEFSAQLALEHNRALAVTIGARVAGTAAGQRAGDYIARFFSDNGCSVEKQAFPFESWEDRGTTLQVTSPESLPIDAKPIQYSPAGSVQGGLVPIRGNGVSADFSGLDLHGKIALISRGTIPFSDKAKNAARAGASAVIVYNNDQGVFSGTLRDRVTIPTLAVSGKDGRSLLDLASKGPVQVSVASDTLVSQKDGHNIIGTLPGTSDDSLVLGAHYDSVQAGPGANDNGSGTAVLMELERALTQQKHKYTLVFIAFDGEEFGLLGSSYYVDHLPASDRGKIKGMLNFDMLGGGSGPLLAGGDGILGGITRDKAGEMGITARNFSLGGNAGSDHEPFQKAGIDTVFFSRDYSLLHTPQDSIDQVKDQYLAEAGRVALKVIADLDQKRGE